MAWTQRGSLRGPAGPSGPDRFTTGNEFPSNPAADAYHYRFGLLYRYDGAAWQQLTMPVGGTLGWDPVKPIAGSSYAGLVGRNATEVPLVVKGGGSVSTQATDLAQFGRVNEVRPLAGIKKNGVVYAPNLPEGAWTPFTLKSQDGNGVTFGNATQNCAWKRIGDSTVAFRILFQLGTSSAITGRIGLGRFPFDLAATQCVSAMIYRSSFNSYAATAMLGQNSGVPGVGYLFTHTGWADENSPFTGGWLAGDYIRVGGTVEVPPYVEPVYTAS